MRSGPSFAPSPLIVWQVAQMRWKVRLPAPLSKAQRGASSKAFFSRTMVACASRGGFVDFAPGAVEELSISGS